MDEGEWIKGYEMKLEETEPDRAEAWGLIDGLVLCWDMGFRKVEVECDATQIVEVVQKEGLMGGLHGNHKQDQRTLEEGLAS